jgi:acyl-[acyl-carrier-protein]-phospholipid O-acyltransferase/long-chain-fatty-acid--[acyl-carrier-protein] ligase
MATHDETRLGRSFAWYNATEFLGALNDNVFRWLLLFFLIGTFGEAQAGTFSHAVGFIFVLPFLLFTPWAGRLADRYSKRSIIVVSKGTELGIVALGCVAFLLGAPTVLYGILFLLCTQAAFFGPSKYSIIPELVRPDQLSKANASVQGLTYLSGVLGTGLATGLSLVTRRNYAQACLVCLAIAAAGFCTSVRIGPTVANRAAANGGPSFGEDFREAWQQIRSDKSLFLAVLASAYFMFMAAFAQMNLVPYGMQQLGLTREHSGNLFLLAGIGIGVGAWLASKASGRHVEVGLVPLAAIGLAVPAVVLSLASQGRLGLTCIMVTLTGISAGLFVVPINALIQLLSPQAQRGRIAAVSNFLGWAGALLAAGCLLALSSGFGLTPPQCFAVLALTTVTLAAVALWEVPDFFVRFMLLIVVKSFYRIKVSGPQRVPLQGPALLVSNHVTWLDAFLIGATQQRRIRFVMSREIYQRSRLKPLYNLMRVILISPDDPPRAILRSLRQAREVMDEGYLVGIFAEGALTRTGMVQEFRSGLEYIVKGSEYPIVPVYLGGAWGSIFSYARGRIGGVPSRIPYPVSIHFGEPMPAASKAWQVRQKVMELSADFFNDRRATRRPLGVCLVRVARRYWHRPCVSDVTGRRLTYGQTLTAGLLLARRIADVTGQEPHIGVLLPPSVAGALTHVALALLRKVSVDLNYTASVQAREAALGQCRISHVVTSRAFLAKLGLDPSDPRYLFAEDLLGSLRGSDKARAWLRARLWPARSLCSAKGFTGDEVAAILLSSGSTGQAKAVMLSHHNILSHLEQMRMVYPLAPQDRFCGILPLFHCFGLAITFWFPLSHGAAVSFVPNPLDAKAVADCIRKDRCTLLMATPTFLQMYLRRVDPADLASLRDVIVGAEKLPAELADRFEQRFGIRPREGYGATELSPVLSISLPDAEADGVQQIGTKPGSVGQPLPGIALKVADPDTGQILPPGQRGLLWVKGPNVMRGYYNAPDLTAEVVQDGWYNTGDIVSVDTQGFVSITDRLSRFSKIGGEMVPHVQVEQVCASALETTDRVVAVTGIPDPLKGEELVVLYVSAKADPERMAEAVNASALPNLWRPRRRNFIPVESIPVLGTGKLDIRRLKDMALERIDSAVTKTPPTTTERTQT